MTNQDVINFLNQVRKMILDDKSWLESTIQPINEAFDKSISALQEQDSPKPIAESVQNVQNEDLISGKAAIDAIMDMCEECDSSYCGECRVNFPGLKDCKKVLGGLPSVQPDTKAQLSGEDATFDCVSRQAAIDIFDDYNVSVENGELEAYSRDRKRLCDLPSAQPEPQWIPVSERLPGENVPVLLGVRFKDDFKFFVSARIDYNYWSGLGREIKGELRWMPLPEPYRAERRTDGKN